LKTRGKQQEQLGKQQEQLGRQQEQPGKQQEQLGRTLTGRSTAGAVDKASNTLVAELTAPSRSLNDIFTARTSQGDVGRQKRRKGEEVLG
jgi:hypothetical protein